LRDHIWVFFFGFIPTRSLPLPGGVTSTESEPVMALAEATPQQPSRLLTVYNAVKGWVFSATDEVLMSLGEFQRQLVQHLSEIEKLSYEIEKENHEFAIRMYECQRDLCRIRDYYHIIINNTKTLVDYGSSQEGIPCIKDLIEEKRYLEAEQKIASFLHYLQKLIRIIRRKLDQYCPSLDKMMKKLFEEKESAAGCTDRLQKKVNNVSQVQYKVFKLGVSAFCYTAAGATTGMIIASHSSLNESQITEALMSAGSEVLKFQTSNITEGMKSVMESSKLSSELQKNIKTRVTAVNECLAGFFKQVNRFQEGVETIDTSITNLKSDIVELEDDDSTDIQTDITIAWVFKSKLLTQLFKEFAYLNTVVVEKQKTMEDEDGLNEIIARLERAIELSSKGTPV